MTEDELPRRNPMLESPRALQVSTVDRAGDEAVIVILLWLDFRGGLTRVSGFVSRGGGEKWHRRKALSLPHRNSKDQQNLFAVAAACLISIAEYIKMRVDAGNIDQTSISRSLLMLRPDRGRRGQKKGPRQDRPKVARAPKSRGDGTLKCSRRVFPSIYASPSPFREDAKSPRQSTIHFLGTLMFSDSLKPHRLGRHPSPVSAVAVVVGSECFDSP